MDIRFVVVAATLLVANVACAAPWSLSVVDENGEPVKARVRIAHLPSGVVQQLKTDAAGHVAGDIEPSWNDDLGSVLIFADGHAPAGGTLRPGENRARLNAPRTLSGRVLDDDGKPLARITVQMKSAVDTYRVEEKITLRNFVQFSLLPRERTLFTARTDANGRYTLQNVPRRGTAFIAVSELLWQSTGVHVDLSKEKEAPDLKTRPAARLRGRVVGADGRPLSGKSVYATSANTSTATDTDARGRYSLGGLADGKVVIRIQEDPQNDPGVAPATEANATIGVETRAPDIRLGLGAVIEVKIMPAVSDGRFILRREDMLHKGGGIALDANDGLIRARVRPGIYRLKIQQPPKGWNAPPHWPDDGLQIEAIEGHTETAQIRLDPALTLSGLARDEAGKPIRGIQIHGDWDNVATTDAEGRFSLHGFKPGVAHLTIRPATRIIDPPQIILPATQPVVITLKNVPFVPVRGRVVDDKGAPIEDATVVFIERDSEEKSSPEGLKPARTGADGRYEIAGVSMSSECMPRASKPKYRFVRGGNMEITRTIAGVDGAPIPNPEPALMASDIVLERAERAVSGRVVDATGKPVANALVAVLLHNEDESSLTHNITRADADGLFQFKELPARELVFIAGAGDGFTEMKSDADRLGDLILQPQPRPTRDVPLARQVIKDMLDDMRGADRWEREALPLALAPYDFQGAFEAASALQRGGKPKPDMLRQIISRWVRADPEAARASLPSLLRRLKCDAKDDSFNSFVLEISRLLPQPQRATLPGESANAAALRAWVRHNFARARKETATAKVEKASDFATALRLSLLAALAVRLGEEAGAERWAKTAIQIALRQNVSETERASNVSTIFWNISKGGADLVEKSLAAAPPELRLQVLRNAISSVASTDMAGARRLIGLLPPQDKPGETSGDGALVFTNASLILHMDAREAAAALALARHVEEDDYHRPAALALAARLQPKAEAAALLREAFDMTAGNPGEQVGPGIMIGVALETDALLGEELLTRVEDRFFDPMHGGAPAVPTFYLARSQPGRARVWIEWQWIRALDNFSGYSGGLSNIAMEMSAVDTKRALEMAASIPPGNMGDGVEDRTGIWGAQRRIAQFLAAPERARQAFDFNGWDADNLGEIWLPNG